MEGTNAGSVRESAENEEGGQGGLQEGKQTKLPSLCICLSQSSYSSYPPDSRKTTV